MTDSNLVRFSLVNEATVGTTPTSPAMQIMRITSLGLGTQNKTVTSEQIDSSRMAGQQILTGTSLAGAFNFEFSNSHYDKLLVAAVLGTRTKLLEKSGATECGAVTSTTTFGVNAGGATAAFNSYERVHLFGKQWPKQSSKLYRHNYRDRRNSCKRSKCFQQFP